MTTHIVLLRGVNVGAGGARVAMADLRQFAADLGFGDPRTLLQSGNLVLEDDEPSTAALERRLEQEAVSRLGLSTDFLVRSTDEWRAAIECNPFPEAAERDPSHLLAFFLKAEPPVGAIEALLAAIKGRETARIEGRQAYLVYPDGIGASRLTNAVIEAKLGARGTGRNWNTVLKLAALAGVWP